MRTGKRSRHALLQVVARNVGGPGTRVGFSVGRQVGGAVVRNRVRRRLRMIVRDLHWRQGYDIVIVARQGCEMASYQELQRAVTDSTRRMGIVTAENA
jgi:ribonuclease P protein component